MGSRIEGMQHMLLRQRILQTLDKTGWSTVLVLLDVSLSFLSVLLYIVMTYGVRLDVSNKQLCRVSATTASFAAGQET